MRCKRNVCSAIRSTGLQFWYNGCCQFCSRLVHVLQELDFVNEAKNCEQCAHNFATMSPQLASKIAFPKIYWQWSTSKLLTMEFMEGVGITDVQAIRGLGVRPADVASLVSETFAEMIFRHGFVHCDPHAANMLLRLKEGWFFSLFGAGINWKQIYFVYKQRKKIIGNSAQSWAISTSFLLHTKQRKEWKCP
jgi:predicted unusual protein kinase regulating ubiquinone biosynthesis (AarF/ABC1/UbiB family)